MMTWPHRDKGAFQFFGHIHSQKNKFDGVDQDLPLHWNQLDVGCDYWDWRPVQFETLLKMMLTLKPVDKLPEMTSN
jgi:calcineurin-like phosphoesterase family protein